MPLGAPGSSQSSSGSTCRRRRGSDPLRARDPKMNFGIRDINKSLRESPLSRSEVLLRTGSEPNCNTSAPSTTRRESPFAVTRVKCCSFCLNESTLYATPARLAKPRKRRGGEGRRYEELTTVCTNLNERPNCSKVQGFKSKHFGSSIDFWLKSTKSDRTSIMLRFASAVHAAKVWHRITAKPTFSSPYTESEQIASPIQNVTI